MIKDSQIIEDSRQIDGRRHVTEKHTDDNNVEYFVYYLAEETDEVEKIMTDRVPILEEQIEQERLLQERVKLLDSINSKLDTYSKGFEDSKLLSEVGLTQEELTLYKNG